ncbi:MAG: Ycf66 family protein [Leptolyngbyaceae cyanobacterium]
MLAYVLAIFIAIGSFSFYMAAFFVPEMHRRQDFVWSGLGMFYAVVLWFCAGRITGAVLLGQTASVVLLGWLGWHTLDLRRDLTPEPVRTPVTWRDLQAWGQGIQKAVNQYLKLGSWLTVIKAAGQDVSGRIADLRNRTAGPYGEPLGADVPPLKRSPAYEFETAVGEGQPVPSEFATVPTRDREPADSLRAQSVPSSTMPDSEAIAADLTPQSAGESDVAATAGEATVAAAVDQPVTSGQSAAPQQPESPETPAAKAAEPAAQQSTQPASVKAPAAVEPTAKPNLAARAASWLGRGKPARRPPQTQRGVIEIPPRPPSIPRSPTAEATQPSAAKVQRADAGKGRRAMKAPRAVIEIPPRPPSIPRSPQGGQPDPAPTASQRAAQPFGIGQSENDDGGRAPTSQSDQSDTATWAEDTQGAITADIKSTESAATSTNLAPSAATDANWSEAESSTADSEELTRSDATRAAETNWPDEDETNWPDDSETNWPS